MTEVELDAIAPINQDGYFLHYDIDPTSVKLIKTNTGAQFLTFKQFDEDEYRSAIITGGEDD